MVSYHALFNPDRKAGGFFITFPDFKWDVSQADSEEKALTMAEDLLATIIDEHIKQDDAIPNATKRRSARYRRISL